MGVNLARGGNSQVHYAKGTPSHIKCAPTACRRAVSGSLSTPCAGCFSPFPHGTGTLSVSREYSALPDGPGRFGRGSTCPALLRCGLAPRGLRVRGCHPLRPAFPGRSARLCGRLASVLQPRGRRNAPGLGSSPVARRYWGNHCCFLLLRVLGCFGSPRSPPATRRDVRHRAARVAPFGYPRIKGGLRLPAAFRSLPRPSSPP